MSTSSAFSTNIPFIFKMQETNGALFFKITCLFISSISLSLVLTSNNPFNNKICITEITQIRTQH